MVRPTAMSATSPSENQVIGGSDKDPAVLRGLLKMQRAADSAVGLRESSGE